MPNQAAHEQRVLMTRREPLPRRQASARSSIVVGALGGLLGGITIWVYELIVWVHFLHLRTVAGLFENSAVLVFGPETQNWPTLATLGVSGAVHFLTSAFWGAVFALLWPALRARGIEATLAALLYGVAVWVLMHKIVLEYLSPAPPVYTTYSVLNGLVSHTFCWSVPVALSVKRLMR